MLTRTETCRSAAWPMIVMSVFIALLSGSAKAAPPYAEEWSVPGRPQDVEVDGAGRVWVSCADDSVRVYSPFGGNLLFSFGGTGDGDGEFHTPYGMAFDPGGNAYICDYEGARVEMFDGSGTFLLSWSIPSTRSDHVAVDTSGDVYVSGYTDASIHKYSPAGNPLLDWTSQGGGLTSGVVESGGALFVVSWDVSAVEQFAPDGTFLGSFDPATLNGTDIEAGADGLLWVADYNGNMIRIFTPDGTPVDAFGAAGSGPGEFFGAIGIALGPDGSVYVADDNNSRLQRFGPDPADGPSPRDDRASDDRVPRGARAEIRSIMPNPCRGPALITYTAPRASRVHITVTDLAGRRIATLEDRAVESGSHRIRWDTQAGGARMSSGVYFVRLAEAGRESVARISVLR